MNKVILIGRLTKDVETRYTQGETTTAVSKYTLAVDRKGRDSGTDFINCVAFGKPAEFAEKYLRKGMKIAVTGRIQTGSYTDKDGRKVYTTDVVVEEHEFVESRQTAEPNQPERRASAEDPFMTIPDGLADELPFN